MPTGTRLPHEVAGLGAASHGGHEEVDKPAGQERAGVLGPAAPDGVSGGEAGRAPAGRGARLHQPAQQG